MSELRDIPNVGRQTEKDLLDMGYTSIESLKCKWWFWKDEYVEPSPCGAVCVECRNFPNTCHGCRKIQGKAYWLQYMDADVCPIFQCCRDRKQRDCGVCSELPCANFMKDPTISDEENDRNMKLMIERLMKYNHRQSVCTIRPIHREEIYLLRDFLYEAIFVPEGVDAPPRDVIDVPELKVYIEDFGQRKDDCCLVAECDGKVVGAVWVRIMNDYGHVDDSTPSLSISLYPEYRHRGIGTRLMEEMTGLLSDNGYNQVSLSVQKANYAVNMYRKLGFAIVKETDEEYIMVKRLCNGYELRHVTENDIPELRELFRSTVLNVNIKDYTQEEAEDWASCGDSVEHWRKLLSENTFIAAIDLCGRIIGFSSMNAGGHLHSMFVHKDWQSRGVATVLLSEVEKLAGQYDVAEIISEVSITARPFFEKRGYEVVKVQKRRANRLELTNFVMCKRMV